MGATAIKGGVRLAYLASTPASSDTHWCKAGVALPDRTCLNIVPELYKYRILRR